MSPKVKLLDQVRAIARHLSHRTETPYHNLLNAVYYFTIKDIRRKWRSTKFQHKFAALNHL